jgi:hypothetical protein
VFAGAAALEPQQEFIRLARTFYTSLVEERMLYALEGNWLRYLSDPARSGMAVTAMTGAVSLPGTRAGSIRRSFMAISRGTGIASPGRRGQIAEPNAALVCVVPNGDGRRRRRRRRRCWTSQSGAGGSRMAGDVDGANLQPPVPSVGLAEPNKERWRRVAREWLVNGIAATPGAGKLCHLDL